MSQQAPVTLAEIKQENLSNQEPWKSTRLLSVNENHVKYRMMRNAEAPWHRREDSDELFIVQTGTITIDVRDEAGNVSSYPLASGQLLVVHRRTEHRARCSGSATLLVIVRSHRIATCRYGIVSTAWVSCNPMSASGRCGRFTNATGQQSM